MANTQPISICKSGEVKPIKNLGVFIYVKKGNFFKKYLKLLIKNYLTLHFRHFLQFKLQQQQGLFNLPNRYKFKSLKTI